MCVVQCVQRATSLSSVPTVSVNARRDVRRDAMQDENEEQQEETVEEDDSYSFG